jgi:hypothetical protein
MKSIVWLASYPKSGNTWLRAFLANYIFKTPEPVPINKVHNLGFGDAIANMYRKVSRGAFVGTDPRSTAKWRDHVLQAIVANKAHVNFVKSHNENGSAFGTRLIPKQLTRSSVYILRNPLDMIISYASHYGQEIDEAIAATSNGSNVLVGAGPNAFQFLGRWSNHVVGWTQTKDFPVLALRYEDLQEDPHDAFARVVSHIGLPLDEDLLDRSIRFASFDELRKQENKGGFIENSEKQERFFRSGKSGQWQDVLSDDQVERVQRAHGKVMRRYGYL